MNKKIFPVVALCLWWAVQPALAAKIHLTNGKVVEGEITERSPDHVRINIRGLELTYFSDEISFIEGEGLQQVPEVQALPPAGGSILDRLPVQKTPSASPPAQQASEPTTDPFGLYRRQKFTSLETANLEGMTKDELIRALIDLSGVRDNLIATFEQLKRSADPKEARVLEEILNVNEVIDQIVPAYSKRFTKEDLVQLVAFYRSGPGKKLLQATPEIMEDVIKSSTVYFEQKAKSVR